MDFLTILDDMEKEENYKSENPDSLKEDKEKTTLEDNIQDSENEKDNEKEPLEKNP